MDPTPPGCLVILIPLSAGMADDVRVRLAHRVTEDGEPDTRDLPKWFAARFLTDELLDGLVNTLAAGYPVPFDVAVIGYRAGDDGKPRFTPLLTGVEALTPPRPDGAPTVALVPLDRVAGLPVESRSREGDPRKWTVPTPNEGTAPAAAALAEAYRLVSVWLTGRFAARPPVVVHCTDGEGIGEEYARVARSLGALATAFGPPRLLHVGFTADAEPTLCGEWAEGAAVPDPWAGLFELSALLPAEPEGRAARWAVSVNDWALADPWSAAFDLFPVEDAVAWAAADDGRFLPDVQQLWTQKMGNSPEQWEDAYAADPAGGVAVVADGASSGIYCRAWANQLAARFVADRPDARDPVALGKWVQSLRGEWRTAINYPKLNWAQQRKVDEVGAAATLLGLEVGPADADGNRPWRACAVGDASLFWVRGGKLHATFPVVAADQFGSTPLLIRSNPGFKTLSLAAAGVCRPGDCFLLATDAVAGRLFESEAGGPGPDWERLHTVTEADWRAEMDALRTSNDMVNDDCTLLALRVTGGEPITPRAEAPKAVESEVVAPPVEVPAVAPEPGEGFDPGTAGILPALDEAAGSAPVPDVEPLPPEDPETTARDGFSDSTDKAV